MALPTPEQLAAADPGYWAHQLYQIKLGSGKFSFRGHEYQIEPMCESPRRVCYMKATGGGFSELEILKTLHALIYRRYKQGALYLFPTTNDVQEFSKARFGPLIQANREAIGRWVKPFGKGTDTASLKKVGDGLLYLRGARLSQGLGVGTDDKESSQLRGIQVDSVTFDEMDLMDDDAIAKALGRMGHSDIKREVYISNPTAPGRGIDRVWQISDQRYWHRRCGCGHWFSADLEFPNCVHKDKEGKGYIACPKCGKAVPMWAGVGTAQWVPRYSDRSKDMVGYLWSHLNSNYNDPAEVLDQYLNPPQGNLDDIYRLRLGLPHIDAEQQLTADRVWECAGQDVMPQRHPGPCAMGVDVGKTKHVVIGIRTGHERYEVVRVARVLTWNDLHDLARAYNVRSAVIDARPYEDEARAFQKAEHYRIFLCEYSESSVVAPQFNTNSGIVKANRTEICDQSHRVIAERRIKLPRRSSEMEEFVKQACNLAKVLETNKRSGQQVYRYLPPTSGGDHYRHALNYFLMATQGIATAKSVYALANSPDRALTEYAVI